MNLVWQIAPIFLSACAGIVYGCSFVLQQRGILFAHSKNVHPAQQFAFFLTRICILLVTGHYLLRSPMIPSILSTIAFFSMFWLIILVIRAQKNERI